jgi:hypothetical protein
MNANENRKYMEAIREMVNHKGGFKVKDILKAHGVPTTCMQVLKKLNWTKGMGGPHGSVWIHAKPHNEAELLQMAITMRLKLEEVNRENYERYYLSKKVVAQAPAMQAERVDMEVSTMDQPVADPRPSKPSRRTPAKRGEVSILWGMIKWTR